MRANAKANIRSKSELSKENNAIAAFVADGYQATEDRHTSDEEEDDDRYSNPAVEQGYTSEGLTEGQPETAEGTP